MPAHHVVMTAPTLASEAVDILHRAGCVVHYMQPYPKAPEIIALCQQVGARAILCRQGQVDASVFAALPDLRIVARHGVGVDEVDIAAARAHGVLVTNAPGSNALQVAEHAVTMMLALVKNLHGHTAAIAAGGWRGATGQGRDMRGLGVGLIGMGHVGQHVARLLAPWGVRIAAYSPNAPESAFVGVERVTQLEDLWGKSDILSIHTPLSEKTRNMVNATALAAMPRHALVVNTGRGGIVDEDALFTALEGGHIAGAALDVFSTEPPAAEHPLRQHPKIVCTPHIAGVTPGSLVSMGVMAAECIAAALRGEQVPADRVVVPGR